LGKLFEKEFYLLGSFVTRAVFGYLTLEGRENNALLDILALNKFLLVYLF